MNPLKRFLPNLSQVSATVDVFPTPVQVAPSSAQPATSTLMGSTTEVAGRLKATTRSGDDETVNHSNARKATSSVVDGPSLSTGTSSEKDADVNTVAESRPGQPTGVSGPQSSTPPQAGNTGKPQTTRSILAAIKKKGANEKYAASKQKPPKTDASSHKTSPTNASTSTGRETRPLPQRVRTAANTLQEAPLTDPSMDKRTATTVTQPLNLNLTMGMLQPPPQRDESMSMQAVTVVPKLQQTTMSTFHPDVSTVPTMESHSLSTVNPKKRPHEETTHARRSTRPHSEFTQGSSNDSVGYVDKGKGVDPLERGVPVNGHSGIASRSASENKEKEPLSGASEYNKGNSKPDVSVSTVMNGEVDTCLPTAMNQEVDASLGRPHTPERTMSTVREDVDHDTHEIYSPDLFVTPPPSTSVMAPLLSSPPRHGASEDFTGQLPTVVKSEPGASLPTAFNSAPHPSLPATGNRELDPAPLTVSGCLDTSGSNVLSCLTTRDDASTASAAPHNTVSNYIPVLDDAMDVDSEDDWELSTPSFLTSDSDEESDAMDVDTWYSSDEDVEMVDMSSQPSMASGLPWSNTWISPNYNFWTGFVFST